MREQDQASLCDIQAPAESLDIYMDFGLLSCKPFLVAICGHGLAMQAQMCMRVTRSAEAVNFAAVNFAARDGCILDVIYVFLKTTLLGSQRLQHRAAEEVTERTG